MGFNDLLGGGYKTWDEEYATGNGHEECRIYRTFGKTLKIRKNY